MKDQIGELTHGAIWRFLADDHARLDSLLERAGSCASADELAAFDQFRRALLHHIAMEEKVLLPAAERAHGAPIPEAPRLRLDHGVLAALMIPSPQPRIVRAIRFVLARHNPLEECPNGAYDSCEWL
ncbi:MAG: hemerythrin domain-containing protein, partial [Candidatus Binatus sp.]|uniref:hemerythrin domain-containing protein n=1 Tax=Candidatus Binatus sp. TaxID=2811406 RepID=UPI002716852B